MVVVCLAGWCMGMQTMLLIDGVKKCVKDHKRYLYKFGKNERSKRDEKMYFSMAGAGNRRRAV